MKPTLGSNGQEGSAALAFVVLLVPLMLTVGTYLNTMTGRNQRLQTEIKEELALLAAESGVDLALFLSRNGSLADGSVHTRTLGNGATFVAEADYLGGDGLDNDGDSVIDDDDEDVFQVTVTGTHGLAARRVAAYLGFVSITPDVDAAVTLLNPSPTIVLSGTPRVNGNNHDVTNTPTGIGDLPGLAIASPGTVADLLAQLSAAEQAHVEGAGGTPSLTETVPVDLNALAQEVANSASVVITNSVVNSFSFGNLAAGTAYISYRNGNVRFGGDTQGAGILVVTGNLEIRGNFRFDGLVIVLGSFSVGAGTPQINGGLLLGPTSNLQLNGTTDLRYSSAAIQLASQLAGRYTAFNGWQEISSN